MRNPHGDDLLLEATGITKTFPGVKALDHVQFRLHSGRLHALAGENGAGKSTLMNILAGVFPPDEGELLLDGRKVSFRSPREAQLAGISIIFQELNLVPGLSIAENIFIGREPLNRFGLIDYARLNQDARVLLEALDLNLDPRLPVERLRVGQQQVIEIAKALSFQSRILIMDEPTSALTDSEVEVLFTLIDQLKKSGAGIIYITHKLDELDRIADDLTVLRDGRLIATHQFRQLHRDEIIRMMVGRDLIHHFPKSNCAAGKEVLNVRNLSLPHPDRQGDWILENVSFNLRRGEVLGVFGLMGSGRTELLQTIYGLHPQTMTGEIRVDGIPVKLKSPREAIESGLAMAPEDRKAEGLIMLLSVAENTSLSCLSKVERFGLLRPNKEQALVRRFVERLQIKTPSLSQMVRNLSGGNQQKVVLAKGLATDPKVLLLDEPTRGIDIGAKKEIYGLIDELACCGIGVVMVSSELPEILAVSDRILVLAEGRKTIEFSRAEAGEEAILKAALPRGRAEQNMSP
jgi:ribose transport system ATP-binding protein